MARLSTFESATEGHPDKIADQINDGVLDTLLIQDSSVTRRSTPGAVRNAGLAPSMGSIGDCYDNGMMESFWGRMQTELLNRQRWIPALVGRWVGQGGRGGTNALGAVVRVVVIQQLSRSVPGLNAVRRATR